MSTTETIRSPTEDGQITSRSRWRRWPVPAVAVVATVALVVWWQLTTPRLEGGGLAGVWSEDHEVLMGTGLEETVFVVPADGGESLLAFGLHNRGPLPAELIDVWPGMDDPMCRWQPSGRELRDDPRTMYTWDGPSRPVAGAVLPPGGQAIIWVAGAHPDPDGCEHAGIDLYEDVEVVARLGGRTSSVRVPMGYTFGYSDDPRQLEDAFGVEILGPVDRDADG